METNLHLQVAILISAEKHLAILTEEICRICREDAAAAGAAAGADTKILAEKFKKTYKNQILPAE